jgi:shikimate kinase
MNSIILIGMPGAGKSTLGVQLAKETARDFVDTDVLIQVREQKTLQAIMDDSDYINLRNIEEQVLLSMELSHYVIATGGSAVYSGAGMAKLKSLGRIFFLDVDLNELHQRIDNYENRGIACLPGQSLENLYHERRTLYQHYADVTIECNKSGQQAILMKLLAAAASF